MKEIRKRIDINDKLEYLKRLYFGADVVSEAHDGDVPAPFRAASTAAYGDMARTLVGKKERDACSKDAGDYPKFSEVFTPEAREAFRAEVTAILWRAVHDPAYQSADRDVFDAWHGALCDAVMDVGVPSGNTVYHPLFYGQAQKWVNMTIKYAWVIGGLVEDPSPWCHFPVDNIMLSSVEARHGGDPCHGKALKAFRGDPWSKWDKRTYLDYIGRMRTVLGDEPLFAYEFHAWKSYAGAR